MVGGKRGVCLATNAITREKRTVTQVMKNSSLNLSRYPDSRVLRQTGRGKQGEKKKKTKNKKQKNHVNAEIYGKCEETRVWI